MAMSHALLATYADVGAPLAPVVFATDAMGSGIDHGGYGIVACDVSVKLAEECLVRGMRPGKTLLKLDGVASGSKFIHKPIERNVPYTKLPPALFAEDRVWWPLESGRWRWSDHITLGEARAVVRLTECLAAHPATRRHKVLSLQDSMPCMCAMAKGRSPTGPLNYLVRRRSASALGGELGVLLPWVQSRLQAADGLSRRLDGAPEAGLPPSLEDTAEIARSAQM